MDIVTMDSIASLFDSDGSIAVSIYLPTHRFPTPQTIYQDQTHFKNLISTIRERIKASTVEAAETSRLLDSLESIRNNPEIWNQTTDGMALFINNETTRVYKLPMGCEERVTIDTLFDVSPLVALVAYDQPYYVLALAVHEPRLYRGTMYSLEPVAIELPESPQQALHLDEPYSNNNTIQSITNPKTTRQKMSFQGQGDPGEAGNDERQSFFRTLDSSILRSKDFDNSLPYIIAGTSDEIAEYRNVSKNTAIVGSHVDGNQTKTQLAQLHGMTWPEVEREVKQAKRQDLIARYNDLVGSNRASHDIADIQDAAKSGRISTLLLGIRTTQVVAPAISSATLGHYVSKIVFPSGYTQSINQCAITVVKQGGEVVGMNQDELPGGGVVAAIYRY